MDNEFDAKILRDNRAKRAERMIEPGDPRKKVDASSWTPPESMQTSKQVQPKRPADPLFRAAGGKTVARADRKPRCGGGMMRASGGKAEEYIDPSPRKRPSSPEEDRRTKAMRDYHAASELAHAARKAGSPDYPELKEKSKNDLKTFRAAHNAEVETRNPLKAFRAADKAYRAADKGHIRDPDLAPTRPPGFANGGATNPVPVSRMSFGQRASTPLPGTTSAMKAGGKAGRAAGGEAVQQPLDLDKRAHELFKIRWNAQKTHGRGSPEEVKAREEHQKAAKEMRDADYLRIMGKPNPYFARGGAANSDEKQDRALVKKMVKPAARTGKANGGHPKGCSCASCSGGRVERASGGRAKGKTNIVIHVNPGNNTPPQPAAAPQAMQPHPAMPLPTAPPPMAPPQGLMPAGGPPPGAMPPVGMPRKRGGRAYYDLEGGAGSGLGRLEKANRA